MKPMLAATVKSTAELMYPKLVSPKLDGVRCLIIDGVAMSRSLKPIPNEWVQKCFGRRELNGLDGELIVGDDNASDVYTRTVSGVMTKSGRPTIGFSVFDDFSVQNTFVVRLGIAEKRVLKHQGPIDLVKHEYVENEGMLLKYELQTLANGYEGVMLRNPGGAYKQGRSTLNEGGLLKLKRFEDGEAVIHGASPLEHNENVAVRNELGHLERSSHQAGKVAGHLLGSLKVRDLVTNVEFEIGTGFTQAQRIELWRLPLRGKIVKYKYQPVGVKDKPRFPVFLGFRDERDM